jgi:hypothetical protein
MAVMNKRLLISESHGDLNRCTSCRGKPDQHDMYASHTSSRPVYAFYGQSLYVASFHESSTNLDGSHSSREKWLPTQSIARRLTDLWVRTQFPSQANQWSNRLKPSFCRCQATRLTGPISPACDRYVQYLLTDTNSSVLNRHRRGLPHRNLRIATTLSPPFPSEYSTGPPKWPRPVSILSNINLQ